MKTKLRGRGVGVGKLRSPQGAATIRVGGGKTDISRLEPFSPIQLVILDPESLGAELSQADRVQAGQVAPVPGGFALQPGRNFLVPVGTAPVQVSKLVVGLQKAQDVIQALIQQAATTVSVEGFDLKEIELALSFSADGKLVGIGLGGAATITVTLIPATGKRP